MEGGVLLAVPHHTAGFKCFFCKATTNRFFPFKSIRSRLCHKTTPSSIKHYKFKMYASSANTNSMPHLVVMAGLLTVAVIYALRTVVPPRPTATTNTNTTDNKPTTVVLVDEEHAWAQLHAAVEALRALGVRITVDLISHDDALLLPPPVASGPEGV